MILLQYNTSIIIILQYNTSSMISVMKSALKKLSASSELLRYDTDIPVSDFLYNTTSQRSMSFTSVE